MASVVSCTAACSLRAGNVRSSMRPASRVFFSSRNGARQTPLQPQVSALAAMDGHEAPAAHTPALPAAAATAAAAAAAHPEQAARSYPHTALLDPHLVTVFLWPIAACRLLLSAAGSRAARWQRRRPRVRHRLACRLPGTSPSASLLMQWP